MAFQDYAHRLHTPFVQSPRGEEDAFVTLHSKNGFSESTPTGWNAMLTRKDTCLQCQVPCWLQAQNTQNHSYGNFSLHLMMQGAVKTSSSKSLPKVWLFNRMGLHFFFLHFQIIIQEQQHSVFLFTFCTTFQYHSTWFNFSYFTFCTTQNCPVAGSCSAVDRSIVMSARTTLTCIYLYLLMY